MVLFSTLASTYMYMYIKYYVHAYWGVCAVYIREQITHVHSIHAHEQSRA